MDNKFRYRCFWTVVVVMAIFLVMVARSTTSSRAELDQSFTSCSDIMDILPPPWSRNHTIYPNGNSNSTSTSTSLDVLCDFELDGGGWTLIQKRSSGPREEFNLNWTEYSNGFGSLSGNFWLGLENIHTLTKNGDQKLRIELEGFDGNKAWAEYSRFSISNASDFYRLNISGFSPNSTAGDAMTNQMYYSEFDLNGMKFTTKDKENDRKQDENCADDGDGDGGWWFADCSMSKLNGLYRKKGDEGSVDEIVWGYLGPLEKTEMKIRTTKSESKLP